MINVTTTLHSTDEIVLHAEFLNVLLQRRVGAQASTPGTDTPPAPQQNTPPQQYTGPQLVKDEPTPAPASIAIDESELLPAAVDATFRAYIHANGAPAARALLDKYGAQYLKDVPADRLVEFVAEIRA